MMMLRFAIGCSSGTDSNLRPDDSFIVGAPSRFRPGRADGLGPGASVSSNPETRDPTPDDPRHRFICFIASSMRRFISSGEGSSLWVASDQRFPHLSLRVP